jgi:capsular exopolysaccharide synthesis family protein
MRNYSVITNEEPHSAISEQYRKVRTAIDFSNLDKELKVLNLTSTYPGEGKTVTAINLATVYSQTKQKTLIIDLDLRKPKIHRAFKMKNDGGVCDYVQNDHHIKEGIEQVNEYLDVLVAGKKVPFPAEVLVSKKMQAMIDELKEMYDRIIIDCPPLTAVTDATIISNFCDGTVFVIASRHTNQDAAKESLKQLQDSGANILGGVLTRVQKRDQLYGRQYYYYYGD